MDKINDLRDMLVYDLKDIYAAEGQIIEAIPDMIENADSPALKDALREHLRITGNHRARLEEIRGILGEEDIDDKNKGMLANLFGGTHKNRGMEGLLDEAQKKMSEDMNANVMDAAIIGCAQKVEHYEICSYGTARTYALQLGLNAVADLLQQTLEEERMADDELTALALAGLNVKAETGTNRKY